MRTLHFEEMNLTKEEKVENPLFLSNTLHRDENDKIKKTRFVPNDWKKPQGQREIKIYGCGPTVYNYAHIGNGRAAVVMDVLYRLLRHQYGKAHVKFVRNITDVDDKIMEAARQSGEGIDVITRKFEKIYNRDMTALGCLQPDVQPRCTEHIKPMQDMIAKLIASGNAYEAQGNVLFSVPSMSNYGDLSRKNRDELVSGARVDVAPYKKDAADFVLWKPSAPEQVGWDSPWGRGRPGWHIECSAMAEKHLGKTFDIHCGGLDLIFPHHENEIAQSECAHRQPMANYWVHNGFLNMGDEKMSKSLGNVVLVHDLLKRKRWSGREIRLALLSAHYRQPLSFTTELLSQSKLRLQNYYKYLLNYQYVDFKFFKELKINLKPLHDDLNTPKYLSFLDSFVSNKQDLWADSLHRYFHTVSEIYDEKKPTDFMSSQEYELLMFYSKRFNASIEELIKVVLFYKQLDVIGLNTNLVKYFRDDYRHYKLDIDNAGQVTGSVTDIIKINARIEERTNAKKFKNFKLADQIRDELTAMGIALEDSPQGTTWRYVGK